MGIAGWYVEHTLRIVDYYLIFFFRRILSQIIPFIKNNKGFTSRYYLNVYGMVGVLCTG